MSKDKQLRWLVTIIAGVIIFVVASSHMSAAIAASERAALISLYNSTMGDGWLFKAGWKTPPLDSDGFAMPGTESTWFGITVTDDHVTEIVLTDTKLTGLFPQSVLSNLTFLKRLILNRNNLSGNISPDLGNLLSLEELNLGGNVLSGLIPASIGNLTNLKKLYLGANVLTGIPPELAKLSNLEELSLRSNQLCGPIPSELGNLSRLKHLDLGFNKLTGAIPSSLGNLSNLENLYLFSNLYSGSIPSELGNLNKLIALDICCIYNENFVGSIPSSLGNLTNLERLDLHSSNLSGSIPPELGNLTNLKSLDLSYNQLTGNIPPELGNLTKSLRVELHHNNLSGNIPGELGNLILCDRLTLNDNSLSGSIPSEFGLLENITQLLLHSNKLTGSIPGSIGNLSKLVYFLLDKNSLTGSIPSTIGNLSNLLVLDISYNHLSGEIPPEFGNLKRLTYFSLGSNELTGNIPSSIGSMTNLTEVYLYKNRLTGNIPPELGNLPRINYLNLSNNYLTGSIPSELGFATSLGYINLEANFLSGSIPASFENLTGLGSLYVGYNQLSGEIPSAFVHFKNMNLIRYPIEIDWNCGFTVSDPELRAFLDIKDPGWDVDQHDCSTSGFLFSTPVEGSKYELGWAYFVLRWDTIGAIVNVKIEYTVDDGAHWITVTPSTLNQEYFNWVPPDIVSDLCRIRISDASTGTPTTTSARFSILPKRTLTLTSTISGEVWEADTSHTITWNSTGPVTLMNLEYSQNNGTSWLPIVSKIANTGSFNWKVPNTPSTQCKVRIKDANGISMDVSPGVFTILELPSFTVKSPAGNEIWEVGSSHPITWTTKGSISNVKIEYSTDNGSNWTIISSSTPNSGSFNWIIPDMISTQCKVRISGEPRSEITDISDAVFSIQSPSTLTLSSPNGSEGWEVGSIHPIKWTYTGNLTNIKIEYSTDNGVNWKNISSSASNNGSFDWTIPNSVSSQCKVRLSGSPDSTAADVSESVFSIKTASTLTLISPNGNEAWEANTPYEIKWTSTGSLTNIKLEYTSDNGASWKVISSSAPNNGTYNWTVPDIISSFYKVRISGAPDSTAADASDAAFKVVMPPPFALTSPNSAVTWEIGTTQAITWTAPSTVKNLKIEYTTDNGVNWKIITSSTPNTGSYMWKIPVADSMYVKVRISEALTGSPSDISDISFRIRPVITYLRLTSPNGGENWQVGSTQTITWTSTGPAANVKLEYFTGTTWYTIVESTPNTGTYTWKVANTPTTTCRINVAGAPQGYVSPDMSDNYIIISAPPPVITVKTPNGGQNLKSGTAYNITWSTTGSVPKVRIDYSINNGSTWTLINASVTNSGTYRWTVPYTSSMKCRVRVRNAANSAHMDISDSVFVIYSPTKPHIYVTPSSLSFNAYKSQMVKYQKTFNISNLSVGTLKWSLKSNQVWLTCSPTSGTGARTITVTVNPANLTPGSYTGTITVTATGSDNTPLAIPIYLNVYQ